MVLCLYPLDIDDEIDINLLEARKGSHLKMEKDS